MRVRQASPDPRTTRWFNLLLGALYLFIAGLLLYFRLGPVERVLARFGGDPADGSSWTPLAFNVTTGVVVAYLLWQGLRGLRRALLLPPPPKDGPRF
jgi:threonine/homoserine/homoserine lactone efflux protein